MSGVASDDACGEKQKGILYALEFSVSCFETLIRVVILFVICVRYIYIAVRDSSQINKFCSFSHDSFTLTKGSTGYGPRTQCERIIFVRL